MHISVLMTQGIKDIGCRDWELVISLLFPLYEQREEFIVFTNVEGSTVITDGNGNHLVTVDNKHLFTEDVWAVYGDNGQNKYYTFILPSEY
jgi:hypothetical protein